MNYRQLLNLSLLVLLLSFFAFSYFKPTNEQTPSPLTELGAEAIDSIEIVAGQGQTRLVKIDNQWFVQGEPPLPAGEYRVKELLRFLSLPTETSYLADEMDLELVGLMPPELQLKFNDTSIAIGAITPLDQQRYLLVHDRVHLIESYQIPTLVPEEQEFISQKLIPNHPEEVNRIENIGYTLIKKEGSWSWPDAPDEMSSDTMTQKAQSWLTARAYKVEKGRLESNLVGMVKIKSAGEASVEFQVGQRKSGSVVEWVFWREDWDLSYLLFENTGADLLALPEKIEELGSTSLPSSAAAFESMP